MYRSGQDPLVAVLAAPARPGKRPEDKRGTAGASDAEIDPGARECFESILIGGRTNPFFARPARISKSRNTGAGAKFSKIGGSAVRKETLAGVPLSAAGPHPSSDPPTSDADAPHGRIWRAVRPHFTGVLRAVVLAHGHPRNLGSGKLKERDPWRRAEEFDSPGAPARRPSFILAKEKRKKAAMKVSTSPAV